MKKLLGTFRGILANIPNDIRQAILSFLCSSLVMVIAISSVCFFRRDENEESPLSATLLEPYLSESIYTEISASADAVPCAASDDMELELLARAIDKAVPYESYAVRVSFGAVLLNRARDESFPSSLSAVIKSAGLYPEHTDSEIPARTLHAARDALLGVDPTFGALYVIRTRDARYEEFQARVSAVYSDYAFLR